jgi:hypothetical protein
MNCSTCGQELTDLDPPPNTELEPLLSGHCRFCRKAADFEQFMAARSPRGGSYFQPWQLVVMSRWLRTGAAHR